MEWILQQTPTGATYLQVVILIAFAVFVITPLAYITLRDGIRLIKSMWKESRMDVKKGDSR